jgi:hypothetical protein
MVTLTPKIVAANEARILAWQRGCSMLVNFISHTLAGFSDTADADKPLRLSSRLNKL